MSQLQGKQSRVLKIFVNKCLHLPKPKRRVGAVKTDMYITEYFLREHGEVGLDIPNFKAWTNVNGEEYDIEESVTIEQVADSFTEFNNVSYKCLSSTDVVVEDVDDVTQQHKKVRSTN